MEKRHLSKNNASDTFSDTLRIRYWIHFNLAIYLCFINSVAVVADKIATKCKLVKWHLFIQI